MSSEGGAAAAVAGRAAQTIATRFGVALLGLATGIIVARAFGPAGKGAYNAVAAFISVPAAVMYGAAAAITFNLVRERRSVREAFPAIAVTYGGVALLLGGAATVYGVLRGWSPVTATLAATLPAAILLAMKDSYYISGARIGVMNAQTVALQVLLLAGAGAAVLANAPLSAVLFAYAAATYLCAAFVVADVVRAARGWDGAGLPKRLRNFLRIAAPSGLNAGLGVLNYRVDSYVLLALLGVVPFGIYSIAVNGGEVLFWLSRPIGAVMSREIGGASTERSAELTAFTVRTSVALTAICGIALVACAPFLIGAVYGERFAPSATPLRLLVPGVVAFSSSSAFAAYFIVQLGRPFAMTVINTAMILVQAAACVLLVPRYGLGGAALGCTITYAFGAAVNTWYFCRCSGTSPFEVWIVQRRDVQRLRRAIAGIVPRAVTVWAARKL
jgi:O-antigen/teichoic acid export membrane protein